MTTALPVGTTIEIVRTDQAPKLGARVYPGIKDGRYVQIGYAEPLPGVWRADNRDLILQDDETFWATKVSHLSDDCWLVRMGGAQ